MAAVLRAGKRQWTAHAWFLERSFPDRWRRRAHYEEVSQEAIAASRDQRLDVGHRISEALQRNPNRIPEALAAMEVLDRVIREGTPE